MFKTIAKDIIINYDRWERHGEWLERKTTSLSSIKIKIAVFGVWPYKININGCIDNVSFLNSIIIGTAKDIWLNKINNKLGFELGQDLMTTEEWMKMREEQVARRKNG